MSRSRDAFDSLWDGADAIMSRAEARLEMGHWLGVHPLRFDPDDMDEAAVLCAVEEIRSYYAVRESLENTTPPTRSNDASEMEILFKSKRRRTSKPKITPNRLWSKTSY